MKLLILTHLDVDTIMKLQMQHDVSIIVGATTDNLATFLHDCEVLIYRNQITISAEMLSNAPYLKQIIRLQDDQTDVDLDYLAEKGIEFVRIPQPAARGVAELAFGLMISLARKIRCMDRRVRRQLPIPPKAHGLTLEGKTLGIIGAGYIGRTTGELGHLWGMRVVGCVANPSNEKARRLREHGIRLMPFEEVLGSADFLVIHVPLTPDTHHLIGEIELEQMKENAFLLNMSAGGVVDEFALYTALINDQIAGAALDAHEASHLEATSPFVNLSNVVLTPHIGGMTLDAQRVVGKQIIRCIEEAM